MRKVLPIAAWLVMALLGAQKALPAGIERSVKSGGRTLIYLSSEMPVSAKPAPVLVFLHGNEQASLDTVQKYFAQWEDAARERGWSLVLPWNAGAYSFTSDAGVHALDAILDDFAAHAKIDRESIYLAGHGDGAPAVFYLLSRRPAHWAAGLAIGGDVARAIDTNRLFAGNAAAIPILWVYEEERRELLQQSISRLKTAGFDLTLLAAREFSVKDSIAWLKPHHRNALPVRVDYETGSLDFTRSFWINIRGFDYSLRNDALDSTRVDPGVGAFLRLGGFGYDASDSGPGIRVKWLPANYKGSLKQEDVITSIGGTMIEDARHYADFMESQRESRDIGIILLRNGKAQRIETRIVIPHRDETETARVHAEYLADDGEIMLVSRGVKSLEVTIPEAWAPVKLSWNGIDMAERAGAGCWLLTEGRTESRKGCGVSAPASSDPAANR